MRRAKLTLLGDPQWTVENEITKAIKVGSPSGERLAAIPELNPAPDGEAGGMGYRVATQIKVLSPEITIVAEANTVHFVEGKMDNRGCPKTRGDSLEVVNGPQKCSTFAGKVGRLDQNQHILLEKW